MKKKKVPFVVRTYTEDGVISKGIFIDDKLFDWGVDEDSYKNAMEMGPKFVNAIHQSIEQHFLESLSEFIGRKVTAKDVNEAMKTGFILI